MVENLIKGYVPKKVEARIPVLSFYGLRKRKLSNDYTFPVGHAVSFLLNLTQRMNRIYDIRTLVL